MYPWGKLCGYCSFMSVFFVYMCTFSENRSVCICVSAVRSISHYRSTTDHKVSTWNSTRWKDEDAATSDTSRVCVCVSVVHHYQHTDRPLQSVSKTSRSIMCLEIQYITADQFFSTLWILLVPLFMYLWVSASVNTAIWWDAQSRTPLAAKMRI